jgi:putative tricarboxylic transport membrane protein
VLDAATTALANLFTIQVLGYLLVGVAVGLVIGVLPGLGGSSGMALLLPFLFGMEPEAGIAMLVGMAAVGGTSDTFSSVLIGVPGSGGSQALILDGHALARQGQAARVLGASFSSSLIGGLIGAVSFLFVITAARPLIGGLGTPELLMFALLGLATVGALVKGDPLFGFAAAIMGVMIGLIGGAPAYPEYRYTFDSLYLYSGVSIVIVTMGLFAVPEVISLLVKRTAIANTEKIEGSILDGFREVGQHKALLVRSSFLGTVLIAPEAANNSVDGGAMVPTFTLGIPASGTTAVMLGGIVLLGLTPGPAMLNQDLDILMLVVWALVLANVLATITCFSLSRYIARVTLVPGQLLAPFLLVLFFAAAYQASLSFGDLLAVLGLGVLGYAMKIANIPRAPAVVGFVLAPSIERYLHLSISRYGSEWMYRPGVISIGVVVLAVLVGVPLLQKFRKPKAVEPQLDSEVDR